MILIFFVFVLSLSNVKSAAGPDSPQWDYFSDSPNGPHNWTLMGNCGGKKQSPINLKMADVNKKKMGLIGYHGYENTIENIEIIHNGNSPTMEMSKFNLSITHSMLPSNQKYYLKNIHFHWGVDNPNINYSSDIGSEHAVEGYKAPLEIHFLHYNGIYSNFSNALNKENALAAIGVFVNYTDDTSKHNKYLTKIFDSFDEFSKENNSINYTFKSNINNLLINNKNNYFYYLGSVTVPTCNENVNWFVYKETLYVGKDHLKNFRNLYSKETNRKILNSFRPLQPIGEKKIFYNISLSLSLFSSFSLLFSLSLSFISYFIFN